ncbi:MAG: hypothetical protein WKF84_25360 [Pyrinomonadaceae bacterium]
MRFLLVLLLGAALGAGAIFYFVVGTPRMKEMAGVTVQAPPVGEPPAGTALLTLDENFFNAILSTIFRDLNPPKFQLAGRRSGEDVVEYVQTQGGCANQVTVIGEGSGVKTGVRIADGKVMAPLAFNGSYSLLGNCLNFKGAGQANIQFAFNREQQTLYGEINVEGVNLEGVNPAVSGIVTLFVQRAINERVNPLPILRAPQLALSIPIQASDGTLKAQVKDVRSEVVDNALRLHINYDFNSIRGQGATVAVNGIMSLQ